MKIHFDIPSPYSKPNFTVQYICLSESVRQSELVRLNKVQ